MLDAAERQGGVAGIGYSEQVQDRLTLGQELYGDRWASRSLHDLIREVREEAFDIGSWSVLAAQIADESLGGERMMHVRMLLQQAVGRAAAVEHDLRQVLDLLAD
jgi:hypothetical protein